LTRSFGASGNRQNACVFIRPMLFVEPYPHEPNKQRLESIQCSIHLELEREKETASRHSMLPVCTWFHLTCRIKIRLLPQWVVH